jgi:hypothetical protein
MFKVLFFCALFHFYAGKKNFFIPKMSKFYTSFSLLILYSSCRLLIVSAEIPFNACNHGDSYRDNCNSCVCDESGVYICSRSSCYLEKQMQETRFVSVSALHSRLRRNLAVVEENERELPMLRFVAERCTPSEIKNEVSCQ